MHAARPWVFKANRLVEAGRLDDAIGAFRTIAESGEPRGWLGLGRCLLRTGERARLEEAVAAIERAAEGEAYGAAFTAGMLLVDPALGLNDGARALPWFARAIEAQQSSVAATRIGALRLTGRCGVTPDRAAAETHFRMALDFENEPEAWLGLAQLALEPDGAGPVEAARCAVRAARAALDIAASLPAHARAEYEAYEAHAAALLHRVRAALEALREADPAVGHWLGEAVLLGLFDGAEGPEIDDRLAHGWIADAAAAGHPRASFVAWVLWQQNVVEADDPDAWLAAAAAGGVVEAAHHLASTAFATGDLDGAVTHAARAAAAPGAPLAAIRLAAQAHAARAAARTGAAAEADERAAAAALLRAAWVRHDVGSMLEIGRRYRDGRGVERDLVEAWRWLMRPMRFGNGDGLHEVHGFVTEMSPTEIRRADLLADGDESWSATFLDQLRDEDACEA